MEFYTHLCLSNVPHLYFMCCWCSAVPDCLLESCIALPHATYKQPLSKIYV